MPAAAPADLVLLGHIKEAYGLQGWVRIHTYSTDPLALLDYDDWWLQIGEQGWRKAEIEESGEHSGSVIARFAGVVERNGAVALRGTQVAVSRSEFDAPDENEYYWSDLIGMAVVNRAGETLGVVDTLQDLGPHQVLEVKRAEKKNLLIPFVASYIDEVVVKDKTIRVDWVWADED
jgi:16S rRNA processing protein RimM